MWAVHHVMCKCPLWVICGHVSDSAQCLLTERWRHEQHSLPIPMASLQGARLANSLVPNASYSSVGSANKTGHLSHSRSNRIGPNQTSTKHGYAHLPIWDHSDVSRPSLWRDRRCSRCATDGRRRDHQPIERTGAPWSIMEGACGRLPPSGGRLWSQIRLNVGLSSLDCGWSARRQITSEPHHADALDCARPLLLTWEYVQPTVFCSSLLSAQVLSAPRRHRVFAARGREFQGQTTYAVC